MDALFEAEFSPLSESGRMLSKCGKCLRYMKYVSSQPSRLYCGTCEEIYYTPPKGTVKVIYKFTYITLNFLMHCSFSWGWSYLLSDIPFSSIFSFFVVHSSQPWCFRFQLLTSEYATIWRNRVILSMTDTIFTALMVPTSKSIGEVANAVRRCTQEWNETDIINEED